jgi:competence protein ComEC
VSPTPLTTGAAGKGAMEAAAPEPLDLRMPLLGGCGWAGGLLASYAFGRAGATDPVAVVVPACLALLGSLAWCLSSYLGRGVWPLQSWTVAGCVLCFVAVSAATVLRVGSIAATPLQPLVDRGGFAELTGVVATDPRRYAARFADQVVLRVRVTGVASAGRSHRVSAPVLVFADPAWADADLGSTVRFSGFLQDSRDPELAALVRARGAPQTLARAPIWWRAAEQVRASIRASVAPRSPDQRALVPALVVGDDARISESLASDFRATGLTHLLAVSGANLTLLVGALLVAARWLGVRGRGQYAVGAAGIIGFVLLARLEPSVVRAAAMGTVGLLGLGVNGRQRGGRALGVAVLGVLLIEPSLADSPGFALSVLATAGIVYLAPRLRDSLDWLPRWLAEAVAIPLAAQLACTPLVAALSGQVSLVAVLANLLAAPAVGPATVLGLSGGLVGLAWAPAGRGIGLLAAASAGWIVLVARWGSDLPTPAVGWPAGVVGVCALAGLCIGLGAVAPRLLASRPLTATVVVAALALVLTRLPTPNWPPQGWVLAACDVGQGDALVLNAGNGDAVVVDAGPDPDLMDRCLRRLEVRRVPLVVLTHFHADHVSGLAGVWRGREVGLVETTSLQSPPAQAEGVARAGLGEGVGIVVTPFQVTRSIGEVRLQALWPRPATGLRSSGALSEVGDEGSGPNNASVVLVAEVAGLRLLLTGDIEPPAQAQLARLVGGLRVDVVKVPHHGSRFQDFDFLAGLRARIAVISAGSDNDYGHPATETLEALRGAGMRIARTDQDGDVVITRRGDDLEVVARDFTPDE